MITASRNQLEGLFRNHFYDVAERMPDIVPDILFPEYMPPSYKIDGSDIFSVEDHVTSHQELTKVCESLDHEINSYHSQHTLHSNSKGFHKQVLRGIE
mmetsp:Transcript_80/g.131  ORF Transcript_80/g.131 Transcript_80/m.131 type:complete len:98 (-) Transcript_80:881-1174(-)